MGKRKKDKQYNGQKKKGQTIQWAKEKRTDNTMGKRKNDRQYNGQKKKGQTIQWAKEKRTVHPVL
jgi:hypothetical protein